MAKQSVIQKGGKEITLEIIEEVEHDISTVASILAELAHYLNGEQETPDMITIAQSCVEKAGYLADRANSRIGTCVVVGSFDDWLTVGFPDDDPDEGEEVAHG